MDTSTATGLLKTLGELTPLVVTLLFLGALIYVALRIWEGDPKKKTPGLGREIRDEFAALRKSAEQCVTVVERLETLVSGRVDAQDGEISGLRAELVEVRTSLARVEGELSALRGPASSRAGSSVRTAPPKLLGP